MKRRKLKNGYLIYPERWIELNTKMAKKSREVSICSDGTHVGIYYSNRSAPDLTESDLCEIEKCICGTVIDAEYNIFGIAEVEGFTNSENVEIVRCEK